MARPCMPRPVLLFLGVLWTRREALDAALEKFFSRFGRPFLQTPPEPFTHTSYYEKEMGPDILRSYLFFPALIDPGELAEIKLWTNSVEETAMEKTSEVIRPVNLDPGYLSLDKFVLATTKDRPHRIYLGRGIYAESTLHFHKGRFTPWPWTYPDYARDILAPVFLAARNSLKRLRKDVTDAG